MYMIIFFLFFLFSFPLFAKAERIVTLDSTKERYELAPYIDILEDKEKMWTITQISSEAFSAKFSPNRQTYPNFGYVSSAYWVRIHMNNRSVDHEWWLEINAPHIDRITFYTPTPVGIFTAKTAGDILPLQDRDIKHRNVVFVVHPEQMKNEK